MARVLVGITGGIAAYKTPGVIRRLREAGNEVGVVATEAAFRFIPEETLSIAAGSPIHTDVTWWEHSGRVEHVSLSRWADLVQERRRTKRNFSAMANRTAFIG